MPGLLSPGRQHLHSNPPAMSPLDGNAVSHPSEGSFSVPPKTLPGGIFHLGSRSLHLPISRSSQPPRAEIRISTGHEIAFAYAATITRILPPPTAAPRAIHVCSFVDLVWGLCYHPQANSHAEKGSLVSDNRCSRRDTGGPPGNRRGNRSGPVVDGTPVAGPAQGPWDLPCYHYPHFRGRHGHLRPARRHRLGASGNDSFGKRFRGSRRCEDHG